jgi:hypothetical protein
VRHWPELMAFWVRALPLAMLMFEWVLLGLMPELLAYS